MDANYSQKGECIDYTNGATALGTGDVLSFAGMAAVAMGDIAASELGSICISGVFAIRKKNELMQAGLPVWWDDNGDPKVGGSGTGAATTIGSAGMAAADILLGSLIAAAAAADEFCFVELNKFSGLYPPFADKVHTTKVDNYAVLAIDSGAVLRMATDAKTFTLPVTSGGQEFTFINDGADAAVEMIIVPETAESNHDKIIGDQITGTATDDKSIINTKATAKRGDFIRIVGDGVLGFYIREIKGIWARGS